MNTVNSILFRTLVKAFYRQHSGLFLFLFIILFGAVGVVDGAGIRTFHFSLIRGILTNLYILLPVLVIWTLYAQKTEQFVLNTIRHPNYSFLYAISQLDRRRIFFKMIGIQFLLFLPINIYALAILVTGFYIHTYIFCTIVFLYIPGITVFIARKYTKTFRWPDLSINGMNKNPAFRNYRLPYPLILVRFILEKKKLLYIGIKLYGCVVLYLMVVNQLPVRYDMTMIFLFFSLGILGHGLLIHQIRNFEENRLSFYRTLPVSILMRYSQYAFLYFLLLIPEFITILLLTPKYLHAQDGYLFIAFSYVILLFLNGLLFLKGIVMKEYMKIILCLFFATYLALLSKMLVLYCAVLGICSFLIFLNQYYQFEQEE